MNKGKAVNVKFVLPIIYKLPKETPVIKLKGGGAAVDKEHNASIVVDGELYENDITDINSLDIESMTVVKKEQLSAEELEKYKAGDKDGVIYITMKKPLKTEGVEIELNPAPEQMAEFPGGLQEMMKYLGSNTKYPLVAREAGLQGRIFVQFIVGKDGAIYDAKVIKAQYEIWYYGEEAEVLRAKLNQARIDLDELVAKNASEEEILAQSKVVAQYNAQFDDAVKMSKPRLGKLESNGDYLQKSLEAEALRVVESMPAWKPGMQGGKPVNTQYVLPIVFRLN